MPCQMPEITGRILPHSSMTVGAGKGSRMASSGNEGDSLGGKPKRGLGGNRSQLNRTLGELESALDSWDKLALSPPNAEGAGADSSGKASLNNATSDIKISAAEREFRERTKKLLQELREQISGLSDS